MADDPYVFRMARLWRPPPRAKMRIMAGDLPDLGTRTGSLS
jgi:hypothetical protein